MLRIRIGKFSLALALRRRQLIVLLFLAGAALFAAAITKPHTFSDGDTLSAAKLNENFDTLYAKVNELDAWKTTEEAKGKSWRLIYETDVTSATTSVTANGLDGDADREYMIHAKIIGNAGGCTLLIRPNNDSGVNYGFQRIVGAAATPGSSRDTAQTGLAGGSVSVGTVATTSGYLYAKSGSLRILQVLHNDDISGTTVSTSGTYADVWNNTGTNITSLVFTGSASCIGAGSHIEIWARR